MELWDTLEFGARTLQLKSIATKSREEIAAIGDKHLKRLVNHARSHSKFWREKLADVGDSFALTDLPTSNKPELMDHFESALTVDDVSLDDAETFFEEPANFGTYFRDKYVLSHTSGSQGQPLIIVTPRNNLELLFELQAARGGAHRTSLGDVVKHLVKPARLAAVILKPGFYPSASALGYMPESAKHFVDAMHLCVEDEDMLERLAEFRPTHLTAYASVLHEIARAIEAGQLTLKPELEQVMNISERLMPQAREHYAEVFGTPILDNYSMGECTFLTMGCPTSGGMHINADWALLEVVDKNNQPVPNGETGARVLITNLANFVQPIIRYEIGDVVTMATEECGCGSNMPLVSRVEGRDSDMFFIETADGIRALQPTVFELALGRVLDAREYQIVQEGNTKFRIRLEPLPGKSCDRDRAEKVVRHELAEYKLDGKLEVEIEIVDRLAADGDKKFKRIITKVKRPEKR